MESAEVSGPLWEMHVVDNSSRGADGVKLADVNKDGLPDVVTGWEEGGVTRICFHPGKQEVRRMWPGVTVGKTSGVEDAVVIDLDEDGSPDIVSCCEGKQESIFIHWGPTNPAQLLNSHHWEQAVLPASQDRMQWMFAWGMQVDGVHGIDLVAGGKNEHAHLGWFQAPPSPRDVTAFQWHPISPVGWLMSLWQHDVNLDGHTDLVISDRYGELRGCRWLENPGPGPTQSRPWKNHFMGGQDREVLSMALVDLDQDELLDAVAAVHGPELLFLRRLDRSGDRWEERRIPVRGNVGNSRAVACGDLNCDGQLDLAVTTDHSTGKHAVFWVEYEKGPLIDQWRVHAISGTEAGDKYDRLELLDLDLDGDLDVLTCEERQGGNGLGVLWYENPHSLQQD